MHDTTPEMKKKFHEMMMAKSPIERLEMGLSMHAFSKKMVISAILRDNPDISEVDLKKQIFLKFYKNDFDPVEREKILQHLSMI